MGNILQHGRFFEVLGTSWEINVFKSYLQQWAPKGKWSNASPECSQLQNLVVPSSWTFAFCERWRWREDSELLERVRVGERAATTCLQEGAALWWQNHHLFWTLHQPSQYWQRRIMLRWDLIKLSVEAVWFCHGWCDEAPVVLCWIHEATGTPVLHIVPLLCGACFLAQAQHHMVPICTVPLLVNPLKTQSLGVYKEGTLEFFKAS